MIRPRRAVAAWVVAVLAVTFGVGLAACGGDDDSADTGCAESPGSKKEVTVIAANAEDVGEVLALADCTPLYTNDVDTDERVRCRGECARVWVPLTLPKGGSVTTQTPGLVGPVSFVQRPDGRRQAALNGKPLYTYSRESEDGASGDGVTDSFGGTDFSWSVMTLADAAPQASTTTP